jgi:hypothetical protein
MWISRKEFYALKDELAELKRSVADMAEGNIFTVYDKERLDFHYRVNMYYCPISSVPHERLSVKDAISRILEKLGMEMAYVSGSPARVALEKKAKA